MLGVSSAPVYGELAWAERGGGAWLDGKPIRVSATAQLGATILSTGNLKTLAAGQGWTRFGALVPQLSRLRGYGDFVHYHLLARGALDVVVESDVNILDIAALTVIVEEAGGRFTDLDGGAVGLGDHHRAGEQWRTARHGAHGAALRAVLGARRTRAPPLHRDIRRPSRSTSMIGVR